MTITETTAHQIFNAIAYTLVTEEFFHTNLIPDVNLINKKTRELFELYCDFEGIEVENEDDWFDDDVDESNYDPYCGCDIFEIDEML